MQTTCFKLLIGKKNLNQTDYLCKKRVVSYWLALVAKPGQADKVAAKYIVKAGSTLLALDLI